LFEFHIFIFIGKQFYGEVLRQAIHEVGPAIILNHLKESKFKDVIKQIKQDLKSIAPDSVDDNDEELYYWNTRYLTFCLFLAEFLCGLMSIQ
jgi:hypothetical protein